MCKYCHTDEYYGADIPFETVVNGKNQHYEINVLEDYEYDRYLVFNGDFSELRVKINYCPFCGEKF